jgi:hypothetical protein
MYAVLATIVSGEADLADVFFLVAAILAAVSAVVSLRSSAETALLPAAVAFGFLGLLVL